MAAAELAWGAFAWGTQPWGGGSPAVIVPPIDVTGLPGLTANDRYQMLVLSEAGTDGVVPIVRYWLAQPPEWGSVLASSDYDSLVHFFATNEDGVAVDGTLETTYIDISPAGAHLSHAIVEFVPRPWLIGSFDGGLNPGDELGFDLVVEATAVRDLQLPTGVGGFVTGVVESDPMPIRLTAEQAGSENWPNAITVVVPIRLALEVHAARLSFRGINNVEIAWAELYGTPAPGRHT